MLENHGCPPPSMQLTPPHQIPPFEAAFDQVDSQGRGQNKLVKRQGSETSPEHFKSKADCRTIPLRRVLQKTLSTQQNQLLMIGLHLSLSLASTPGVSPKGIPHPPLTNPSVPSQRDTAQLHIHFSTISRLTLFSS